MTRGISMTTILIIFVACIILFAATLYLNEERNKSDYTLVMSQLNTMRVTNKALDERLTANIQTIGNNNIKTRELAQEVETLSKEIDSLQVYCAKMKDSQVDLQDQLSKKRPVHVHKHTGMIPIEVYTPSVKATPTKGKGVEALIKKK